jgi:predicted metal-dependent enzyme (double-stranded beta helix superfamily)
MNAIAPPSSRDPLVSSPSSAPPTLRADAPFGRSDAAARLVEDVRRIDAEAPDAIDALEVALRRFADDTAIPSPDRWCNTTGRYTRVLLNDPSDPFQIIVVFWPPGARSAIHDHADTRGAVMALFGEVTETKYSVLEGESADRPSLVPSIDGVLESDVFSPIVPEPGMQLHDMVNTSYGWAATVHVYLRAIRHFHVYRAGDDGSFHREQRALWFDYARGAEAWDEPETPAPSSRRGELCRRGSCACGALRFESSDEPVLQLRCYCTDCQKSTGSVMAPLAFFPSDAVTIVSGETRVYEKRNDSGYVVSKEFCPCCGTTVFHGSTSYPHLRGVPVGVLDDPTHFRPTTNIYVGSAPAWARSDATHAFATPR